MKEGYFVVDTGGRVKGKQKMIEKTYKIKHRLRFLSYMSSMCALGSKHVEGRRLTDEQEDRRRETD